SQPFTSKLVMSNPKLFKYEWIWEKQIANNFMSAKYQPLKFHENVLVFGKGSVNYYQQKYKVLEIDEIMGMDKKEQTKLMKNKDTGYRNPKSVLKINKKIHSLIHPTQKPVELFKYLIKTYTNKNETVLDNCMGSGTTAIACMNTERNFIGFELDKTYYEKSLE